nr:unnamed protein product [Callosobruchus chinensis]
MKKVLQQELLLKALNVLKLTTAEAKLPEGPTFHVSLISESFITCISAQWNFLLLLNIIFGHILRCTVI